MKKFIPMLAVTVLTASLTGIPVHAETLDKDYIINEIWTESWYGMPDDGITFPEASYKYHLLSEWVSTNYGDENYNWSDVGELTYSYKDYYKKYIADFDFNDDDNGNWTIDTSDHSYHFEFTDNQWNMIDENGDITDTFSPHSTLESKDEPEHPEIQDNDNQSGNIAVKPSVSDSKGSSGTSREFDGEQAETEQTAPDGNSEGMNTLTYVVIGIVIIAVAMIIFYLFKNRK